MSVKFVVYRMEVGYDLDGRGPERWRGMELGRFDTEDEAYAFGDRYPDYFEVDQEEQ